MSGSSQAPSSDPLPLDVVDLASRNAGPMIEAIQARCDVLALKHALREAQFGLANNLHDKIAQTPIIWVNTYFRTQFEQHASSSSMASGSMNFEKEYVFSPAAVNPLDQDAVDRIHQGLTVANQEGKDSLTKALKALEGNDTPDTISFYRNGDQFVCESKVVDCAALQHYKDLLPLENGSRYVHVGLTRRLTKSDGSPVESAGVYLMINSKSSWERWGPLLSSAFRYFLLEIVYCRVWEIALGLLKEKKRVEYIYSQILEPTVALVKQLDAAEAAVSRIRSMVVPTDASILTELRKANDFFVNPPQHNVKLDSADIPAIHSFQSLSRAQQLSLPIFVCAVVAKVLGLDGRGLFADKEALVKLVDAYVSTQRESANRAVRALWHILNLFNQPLSSDDLVLARARAEILKGICHTPFKFVENSFDANLFYGMFGCRPGDEKVVPYRCRVAGPPQEFVNACWSLLAPRGLNGENASTVTIEPGAQLVTIERRPTNEGFEEIQDPNRLVRLVQLATTTRSGDRQDQAQGAEDPEVKTYLYEWATSKVDPGRHWGDTVTTMLMLFGSLASEVNCHTDNGTVTLYSKKTLDFQSEKIALEIKLVATSQTRKIIIQNERKQ